MKRGGENAAPGSALDGHGGRVGPAGKAEKPLEGEPIKAALSNQYYNCKVICPFDNG